MRRKVGSLARRVRASPRVSRTARAVELMVPGGLCLFFDDAVLFCLACVETLCCIGTAASKTCGHILNSWTLKEVSHESFVFTSSTSGI